MDFTGGITFTGGMVVTVQPPPSSKAIFGYGGDGGGTSITNLVSNTGVVANNVTGVGTIRFQVAAATYGTDKALFGYGRDGSSFAAISTTMSPAFIFNLASLSASTEDIPCVAAAKLICL